MLYHVTVRLGLLKDRILLTQFATSTIITDVPQHARQPLQVALLCFALLCFATRSLFWATKSTMSIPRSYLIPHSPFKASPTALNVVCASAKAFLFFNIVSSALIQACFRINSGFILANCSSTMATASKVLCCRLKLPVVDSPDHIDNSFW